MLYNLYIYCSGNLFFFFLKMIYNNICSDCGCDLYFVGCLVAFFFFFFFFPVVDWWWWWLWVWLMVEVVVVGVVNVFWVVGYIILL